MTRRTVVFLVAFGILAAAAGKFLEGKFKSSSPTGDDRATPSEASRSSSISTGPIIYYRDPDGKPLYSAVPKKTAKGRDYVPVRASEDVSFEEKQPPASPAKGERRVGFYRNPMGLADTSPVPKKDPMGMDYVPVYEDEAQDSSTVTISPGKLQKTGVRSELVERRKVIVPVRAAGKVEFNPNRMTIVSLRFEGFIEKVENVAEGDYVRKGQSLMRLYGPALSAAAAEYVAVLNSGGPSPASRERLEGARHRLANLGLSDAAIAEIARTRSVPRTVAWPAPQDGHILERAAFNGMRAGPGDVLFRIVDHSDVWVLADVAERDIGLVSSGQTASVRPRAYPDRLLKGRVALISPHLNMETRTARVRIELPNPDGLLRGDMYADVEIEAAGSAEVLAVPESAVIDTGTRQVVILDKGEGRFQPREVTLGRRGEGFAEVRKGLGEGDRVVTSALFLIDAESNLKAALQALEQSEAGR
jgi:membrane fusion protein, copper/silver efflux system